MGGVGSGRKPDIYRQFTKKEGPIIPAGEEIVLPNLSGDHSAGHTGTPSNDTDLVNKKYVDDEITTHEGTAQAHSDYMLNTGDTATGDYHFDAMSLSGSNVGIGTTSPASKLEVVGDVNVSGPTGAGSSVDLIVGRPDNTQADLILYGDNGVGGPLITLDNAYSEGGNINNWQIGPSGTGTDNILTIGPNTDTDAFTFHSNGNVGIRTASPATPLHISGGAVTISNASAPSTPANAGAIFVSGGQVWCMGGSGTQTLLGAA